ncbi:MAG: hypothetical protein ABI175_02635 [Polyangiales bacterium]
MSRHLYLVLASCTLACSSPQRPFPMRPPMTRDTDLDPVDVACRKDPSKKDPDRVTCAPKEYISPFVWDHLDNALFARLSRVLSFEVSGEAANATSIDEVADSAWFENRIGKQPLTEEQRTLGACKPEDLLPAEVADGEWVVDHGKDNGSTPGFRVKVPGKGQYLLKADEPDMPERASAASVVGAAIYNAAGFSTSCEQVVFVHKEQFKLEKDLKVVSNGGIVTPFDEATFEKILADSPHVGKLARMQASKWLPGVTLGPFRYRGTRGDDPNDIIPHEDRRELRGSRVLAAWLNHWDAREQNSMDIWFAVDPKRERSSPGIVRHYIVDTSDVLGGRVGATEIGKRMGWSYIVDFRFIMTDFLSFGAIERPWDDAFPVKGHEKFGMFSARAFAPDGWKPVYPNPAFRRMTERDAAWMARIIARFTPADIRSFVAMAKFSNPSDTEYLTQVLIDRQHAIVKRYLSRLSPLVDARASGDQICALDLARASGLWSPTKFRYRAVQKAGGKPLELPVTVAPDGTVCVRPQGVGENQPVTIELRNGAAGPLEIHAYGMMIAGMTRPD